jgi:hypothetical protein
MDSELVKDRQSHENILVPVYAEVLRSKSPHLGDSNPHASRQAPDSYQHPGLQPLPVHTIRSDLESSIEGNKHNQESSLATKLNILNLRASQTAENIIHSTMDATTTSASLHNQQQAHCSDHTSRPRSRAIAIKTPTNRYHTDDLASSEESNERMYDWATWRMYNRIVDHRRNQRFSTPTRLPMSAAEQQASRCIDSEAQNFGTTLSPDYSLDGAVFELDI